MIKNCRVVLASRIGALPVFCSRIMYVPENLEKLFLGNFLWIEGNFHSLEMPRRSRANNCIRGIFHLSAGVADSRVNNPWWFVKDSFWVPKASCRKNCFFCPDSCFIFHFFP